MATKQGKLIIYAGPSGVGKGTVKSLFMSEKELNLVFSISATTRSPRDGETNGIEYHFISKETFREWIENNKFLEWAEYNTNYYGTPIDFVKKQMDEGKNVLLEIEVEGVKQILKMMPSAVTIFLLPPSIDELKNRLEKRGTETKEQIESRIKTAINELNYQNLFKYLVINDKPNIASSEIIAILKKELEYE